MFHPASSPLPPAQLLNTNAQRHTPVRSSATPVILSVEQEIHQLRQALTYLKSAAEQGVSGTAIGAYHWPFEQELPAAARHAEAAMKSLGAMALPATAAWIELTHALTVVVLAADMLSEGHLSPVLVPDTCTLLHRNAERALDSLDALYPRQGTSL